MVDRYLLTPTDLRHESWQYSVTANPIRLFASGEADARRLAGDSLRTGPEEIPVGEGRYRKMMPPVTPWERPEVTSCQIDNSRSTHSPNFIVGEDGEVWLVKW